MQFLLNKDHQHHKWQQQASWITYPDCLVAQGKGSSWRSMGLYPSKNGGDSQIIENSHIRNLQTFRFVYNDTNGLNHCPVWRPGCSSWAESVQSSFGRTIMGKAIWENVTETWLGKGFQLGMLIFTSWSKIILICACGWHKSWLERSKILIRCGMYSIKKLICEYPGSCILGLDSTKCEISKDITGNYRTMFESRISAREEVFLFSPTIWKIMPKNMERYCKLSNKTTSQLHKVSTPCIDAISKKKQNLLKNCHKHAFKQFCEQNCTINQKMAQGLWQTFESIDILHSSFMWIQIVLLCW